MNTKEAILLALHSMRAARLRTVLTTFGIAVGIAAVILLNGLGNGMKAGFASSLGSFSTAVTINRAVSTQTPGGAVRVLREDDAAALANPAAAPDIASVTPIANGSSVVRYNGIEYSAQSIGTDNNYFRLFDRQIASGRMFTEAQEQGQARVVLLGPGLVNAFYGGNPWAALDTDVQIGRLTFTVVGTITGGNAIAGLPDDVAVMPLNASRALFGRTDKLNQIGIQTAGVKQVPAAIDEIDTVMDRQHGIREAGLRDYTVAATLAQVQKTNSFLTALTRFVLGVAGIALFVGGLGVANIMLVTVTERTHEIGIRKAIGARRSAILKQFLVESTVLAGVGGVAGVILGIGITLAGARILPSISPNYGVPTVSPPAVAVAFGISLLLGLLAGGHPARRAARLHPIDALRH